MTRILEVSNIKEHENPVLYTTTRYDENGSDVHVFQRQTQNPFVIVSDPSKVDIPLSEKIRLFVEGITDAREVDTVTFKEETTIGDLPL